MTILKFVFKIADSVAASGEARWTLSVWAKIIKACASFFGSLAYLPCTARTASREPAGFFA
jgi:hypothetical protein